MGEGQRHRQEVKAKLQIHSVHSIKSDASSDLLLRPATLHWSPFIPVVHPVYLEDLTFLRNVFPSSQLVPQCREKKWTDHEKAVKYFNVKQSARAATETLEENFTEVMMGYLDELTTEGESLIRRTVFQDAAGVDAKSVQPTRSVPNSWSIY